MTPEQAGALVGAIVVAIVVLLVRGLAPFIERVATALRSQRATRSERPSTVEHGTAERERVTAERVDAAEWRARIEQTLVQLVDDVRRLHGKLDASRRAHEEHVVADERRLSRLEAHAERGEGR